MSKDEENHLHAELLEKGSVEWNCWKMHDVTRGTIIFKSFEQAMSVLINGSSIDRVRFVHSWYTDYSWIPDGEQNRIFKRMHEALNDDCIRHVIKFIDFEHIIKFAHFNDRFKGLAEEKLRCLHIIPSMVGTIGMMNFRYLLNMFGDTMTELSISRNAIQAVFGLYTDAIKNRMLSIICETAGSELKNIFLYDFIQKDTENIEFQNFLELLSMKGIDVDIIFS